MIFDGKRCDGAGFFAKCFKGRFAGAEKIHDSVNILLKRTHAAETSLRAIIVVAEENRSSDILLGTEYGVVCAENFHAAGIVFWALRYASAISVLRDDNRLAGKGRMYSV